MYAQDVPGSFDAVVDYTFQKSFLSVYTADTSHPTVDKIMRAAEEYARTKFNDQTLTATVGGGAVAIAEGFNRDIAKWLVYTTVAATLLSFVVLVPMSGSFVGPALLLAPLVMGSVIWLVLMQLSGVEINSNTTTGMAIASGVGVDAELYLLGRFREEYQKHGNFRLALATFGGLFFFWFLAWNEAAAGPGMLAVLRRLSLFDRFYDFSRGTVQSRDVIYFFVVATLFVLFSLAALQWRWQQGRGEKILRLVLLLMISVGIEDWGVRHNRTWELVQEKESLLAPETIQGLAAVQVPVRLLLFYEPGRYQETAYLAEKCSHASPFIQVQLVDLDREPTLARTYGVRVYGTVIVESGGRREVVYPAEEQLLVRAVASVTDPRPRLVCVSTGHGEHEMTTEHRAEDEEPTSVGDLFERLGYQWQEVMLAQAGAVPQDCRFLFVPGPTHDFADAELSAVEQFLAAGGSALLLLDPLPLPRIEAMLGRYHVLPGGEIVPQGAARLYLRDRQTVPVVDVALSPREPERFTAVLYGVRRVDYVAVGNDMSGGVFLGYRSPTQGLIPVGIAVETAGEHGGRLMVVGDADFLAGALFLRDSNRMLFTRMLHWLGERRGRESQARARYAYAPLTVGQSRLLFWTVMAPPLAFLAAGGFAWWQRRRGERLET
jgi:hypothetical protein